MPHDTINDAQTVAGDAEAPSPIDKVMQMDKSIGEGVTMKPDEKRGGRTVFAPGDVIAGRYVVEKILGEGGMGIVYQCLDRVGGVKVAVKCLPPEVSRSADEMEDIRANYRIVADLHHPNIAGARTLEMDEATGDYYLVMDLARGVGLKRWMRRNPQAAMAAKLAILRQVAAALDYAHARKVIHRDVKPENVMVDDEGGVKVLDFGLAAQIRSSQSRTSAAITSRGGTPGYKSPEQWRGKPQREQSDVYSFGVMAYWMFAGELPFDGDDPVVLGHAVLTEPVELIAGLSAHTNAALAKALAKKPEDRFSSCTAFVDALEGKGNSSRVEHAERVAGGNGRAGAPRPPQDNGGARPPAEPGSRVPRDHDDATEEEAKRARAETKIRMLRLEQISDDDGFAKRKSELNDAFQKSDIFFESGLWADAASRFAECSRQVENLEKLDSERKTAMERRKKAITAQSGAKNAQAGKYATAEWENAIGLLSEGEVAYGRMDFIAAIAAFSNSAAGFSKSEHKAIEKCKEAERKAREEAERKQREWTEHNKACVEAERKARERGERKAREVAERKAREEAERKTREEAERKAREESVRKAREEVDRKTIEEWARCGKVQLWEGGPYWATKNIGAENPIDYGFYFWWGDTVGYKREGAAWVASDGSKSKFSFEDDNTLSYDKSIGKLKSGGWITVKGWFSRDYALAPKHDAARVHWGGRMAHADETRIRRSCQQM